MKPQTFAELYQEAERHEDYWVAGAILDFTESLVREMERQGLTRIELARRLGVTPAYVTKVLRGKVNFTLATMVRLARALDGELRVEFKRQSTGPSLRPKRDLAAADKPRRAQPAKAATTEKRLAARKVRLPAGERSVRTAAAKGKRR